jgi:5-methylcytosine-specific restriction endonuclease McrA
MADSPKTSGSQKTEQIVAEARRIREQREKTYRERALKLFPWVCGRCGREFEGKRLRELTVHHKDHNHNNNPPDGSNWELLCVYCHDNEHSRYQDQEWVEKGPESQEQSGSLGDKPFAALEALLKQTKDSAKK